MQNVLFDGDVQELHDEVTIASLQLSAERCRKCALCEERTSVVFGSGNTLRPRVAFVGEAPGKTEDATGLPFAGRSGKVLNQAIEAMGLSRSDVYVCNVVCCRPPGNRKPTKVEAAACKRYLHGQLLAIKPEVIVALGASAAQFLLSSPQSVDSLRLEEWHYWKQFPVRVTYHPVLILRAPRARAEMWRDLQSVTRRLDLEDRAVGD